MKVLLYSPVSLSYRGGVELYFEHMASWLRQRAGDEVHIVCGNLCQANRGFSYQEICFYKAWRLLIPSLASCKTLYKEFLWADVVYLSYGFFGQDLLMLLLKLVTKKRVIAGIHAPLFHDDVLHNLGVRFLGRLTLPLFDGVHLLSKRYQPVLSRWGVRRSTVIPCGIDIATFRRTKPSARQRRTILFVGRLEKQKGADLLLEIIPRLPEFQFLVVGDGSYRRQLAAVAQRVKNLSLAGALPYEELPDMYARAGVLLFPSRAETSPAVLFEALAVGLPVLASPIAETKEILGREGFYVRDFEVEHWVEKIRQVLSTQSENHAAWLKRRLGMRRRSERFAFQLLLGKLRDTLLA